MDSHAERKPSLPLGELNDTASMHFEPILSEPEETGLSTAKSRTSQTRSLARVRSQNGYSVADEPVDFPDESDLSATSEKDPFEVTWDGGSKDPLCPRGFNTARRWMIVCIVAGGSLAVYVYVFFSEASL